MMDAINAKTRPIAVNTFGERPVAAKDLPIFCNAGFNESRRLFNNNFPHFRFIDMIIDIKRAAKDAVEPLSNVGFNSTISAALIFLS